MLYDDLRVMHSMLNALPHLSPSATPSQVSVVFSEHLLLQDVNFKFFDDLLEKMRLGSVLDGHREDYIFFLVESEGGGEPAPFVDAVAFYDGGTPAG